MNMDLSNSPLGLVTRSTYKCLWFSQNTYTQLNPGIQANNRVPTEQPASQNSGLLQFFAPDLLSDLKNSN